MRLGTDLWVRDLHWFKFMLETFIESQIYNQNKIDGLNFITSVNFARRLNDFGQVNLCLNLLMMSMFIFMCFFPLRLRHIKLYTITVGRPCPNVLIPLHNICDFHVISKDWNSKQAEILLFYKRRRKIIYLSSKHKTLYAHIFFSTQWATFPDGHSCISWTNHFIH